MPARFIFLILLVLALVLPACRATPQPVTITVQMFEGPEADAMRPTAAYWNEHYAAETGITVQVTHLSRVGYFNQLETQLIAQVQSPDIVHPFSLQVGRLAEYLLPLDDYVQDPALMQSPDGATLTLDQVLTPALQTARTADGRLIMLPIDMSEYVLYYRTDLIAEPPQTWDDFVATARQFTRRHNPTSPTEYGAAIHGKYVPWTFCAALETLWAYGVQFNPAQREGRMNTPQGVQSFQVFATLAAEGLIPPETVNAEYFEIGQSFGEGQAAMAIQANAYYHQAADAQQSPLVHDRFAIAPPPGVRQADGRIERALWVHTIGLAVNRSSPQRQAAVRFVLWATLGEGARLYAQHGGSAPIRDVWLAADAPRTYRLIGPWIEQFGRSQQADPRLLDAMMLGTSWIQRLTARQVSAQDAALGLESDLQVLYTP
jgi:ABC-type glycerol-3-phosphate transport system substrate-binding protein